MQRIKGSEMISTSVRQLANNHGITLNRVVWMPDTDLACDEYNLQIRSGPMGANILLSEKELLAFNAGSGTDDVNRKLSTAIDQLGVI